MPRPLVLLLAVICSGCTATLTTIRLLEVDRAVAAAAGLNAEQKAPYEYTMAVRHRDEAWDASNHRQYRVATDLCRTSLTWADQAQSVAAGGSRKINVTDDNISDDLEAGPDEPDAPGDKPPPPERPPDELDEEDFLDEDEDPKPPPGGGP